jgi:hypothetical protein
VPTQTSNGGGSFWLVNIATFQINNANGLILKQGTQRKRDGRFAHAFLTRYVIGAECVSSQAG